MSDYQRFRTPCDLSMISLAEAIIEIEPSFVYTLRVNPALFIEAHLLVKNQFTCDLPVHINIVRDRGLKEHEWFVENTKDQRFGSEGVT